VNALTGRETRNVLALVRAAFATPETIAPDPRDASRTLLLLRRLAERANQDSLKQQIEETIAWVQAR
jgi:hypothetical protein